MGRNASSGTGRTKGPSAYARLEGGAGETKREKQQRAKNFVEGQRNTRRATGGTKPVERSKRAKTIAKNRKAAKKARGNRK